MKSISTINPAITENMDGTIVKERALVIAMIPIDCKITNFYLFVYFLITKMMTNFIFSNATPIN